MSNLILSRKAGERITIGDDVELTVVRMSQGRVRLAIKAPAGVRVMRAEVDDPRHVRYDRATELWSVMIDGTEHTSTDKSEIESLLDRWEVAR